MDEAALVTAKTGFTVGFSWAIATIQTGLGGGGSRTAGFWALRFRGQGVEVLGTLLERFSAQGLNRKVLGVEGFICAGFTASADACRELRVWFGTLWFLRAFGCRSFGLQPA